MKCGTKNAKVTLSHITPSGSCSNLTALGIRRRTFTPFNAKSINKKGGGMEEQLTYMLELNAYLDDWAIP